MAKILRLSDRIKLTIGEVVFTIAPLNYFQKIELSNCTMIRNGEDHYDLLLAQSLYLKYGIKGMTGVKDCDGNDYELEFKGDELTDECISEILHLEQRNKLTTAAWQLLNGIQELADPLTGKKLKGVKVEVVSSGK